MDYKDCKLISDSMIDEIITIIEKSKHGDVRFSRVQNLIDNLNALISGDDVNDILIYKDNKIEDLYLDNKVYLDKIHELRDITKKS